MPSAKTSRTSWPQIAVLTLFTASISGIAPLVYSTGTQQTGQPTIVKKQDAVTPTHSTAIDPAEAERCKVPEFAKKIGHEDKWKLHNNCQ
jgi:hypothetical protein